MEEEITNRPMWLLELENRKRKVYKIFQHVLVHTLIKNRQIGGKRNVYKIKIESQSIVLCFTFAQPRLAHEAGAGAPCTNCNSACPGLDLHYWRKICKNCKCGRDDHDVNDDEFPQFDLLFGPKLKKFKKKSICKYIHTHIKLIHK